jgi:archaellum biogenesis ATPase FlaH
MSGDNVGIDWLLPNYFARGALSIIGGDAGSGKSLLCYMLVTALATQGKILGQQVTGKYKSLFIQQDEPKGTTQERLGFANLYKDGKANPDYKDYVTLNHKSQHAWKATPTGLKLLDKVVEEGGYDFIIIDNLKHVLPNDVDLYHPEVERKILIPLKEIATKHDCHILVLHHTNKGEGLIGSNSIKDSANYVGMLKNKNGYKTLQDIKQRDCPDEQEVTYEVTVNDDGIWTMKITAQQNNTDLMEANDVPNFHKDLGNHFDNCHRHKKPLTVTVKDLEGITGLTHTPIKVKLAKLVASGHLVQLPTPKNKANVWQATDLFNKDY